MDDIHLFLDIPQDVIGLILLQLEVTSTVLVALTCRALQKATKDIWRHQTLRITDFNTVLDKTVLEKYKQPIETELHYIFESVSMRLERLSNSCGIVRKTQCSSRLRSIDSPVGPEWSVDKSSATPHWAHVYWTVYHFLCETVRKNVKDLLEHVYWITKRGESEMMVAAVKVSVAFLDFRRLEKDDVLCRLPFAVHPYFRERWVLSHSQRPDPAFGWLRQLGDPFSIPHTFSYDRNHRNYDVWNTGAWARQSTEKLVRRLGGLTTLLCMRKILNMRISEKDADFLLDWSGQTQSSGEDELSLVEELATELIQSEKSPIWVRYGAMVVLAHHRLWATFVGQACGLEAAPLSALFLQAATHFIDDSMEKPLRDVLESPNAPELSRLHAARALQLAHRSVSREELKGVPSFPFKCHSDAIPQKVHDAALLLWCSGPKPFCGAETDIRLLIEAWTLSSDPMPMFNFESDKSATASQEFQGLRVLGPAAPEVLWTSEGATTFDMYRIFVDTSTTTIPELPGLPQDASNLSYATALLFVTRRGNIARISKGYGTFRGEHEFGIPYCENMAVVERYTALPLPSFGEAEAALRAFAEQDLNCLIISENDYQEGFNGLFILDCGFPIQAGVQFVLFHADQS